jgi:hypothetical protein
MYPCDPLCTLVFHQLSMVYTYWFEEWRMKNRPSMHPCDPLCTLVFHQLSIVYTYWFEEWRMKNRPFRYPPPLSSCTIYLLFSYIHFFFTDNYRKLKNEEWRIDPPGTPLSSPNIIYYTRTEKVSWTKKKLKDRVKFVLHGILTFLWLWTPCRVKHLYERMCALYISLFYLFFQLEERGGVETPIGKFQLDFFFLKPSLSQNFQISLYIAFTSEQWMC